MSDNQDRGPSTPISTLARGDAAELRISLDEFKGHRFLNLRVWNKGADGEWRPDGKRGLAVKLRELSAVADALAKAIEIVGQR